MLGRRNSKRRNSEGTRVHGIDYLPQKTSGSFKRIQRRALVETPSFSGDWPHWKDTPDIKEEWMTHEYPFENLVFSAGGTRAIAYAGCMSALEDAGIAPNIKRFAGCSSGSITACLLAVGCTPQEVINLFMRGDDYMKWIIQDQKCTCCCIIPRLITKYGLHPMNRFYEFMGDIIGKKTGNRNITFEELYLKYDRELCIVVSNITTMKADYCHTESTPDLPIRDAVRMSVAIPGIYEPATRTDGFQKNIYVDGAMLNAFPLHVFDGTNDDECDDDETDSEYSSDEEGEDREAKLERLAQELKEVKGRSLGLFMLSESILDRKVFKDRYGGEVPYKPTYSPATKLFKKKLKDEFLRRQRINPLLTKKQMQPRCKDTRKRRFSHFQVPTQEASEVTNLGEFLGALIRTMVGNQKGHVFDKEVDLKRIIPINCGYIDGFEMSFETEDRRFLVDQGYQHTRAFLIDYIAQQKTENGEEEKSNGRKNVQRKTGCLSKNITEGSDYFAEAFSRLDSEEQREITDGDKEEHIEVPLPRKPGIKKVTFEDEVLGERRRSEESNSDMPQRKKSMDEPTKSALKLWGPEAEKTDDKNEKEENRGFKPITFSLGSFDVTKLSRRVKGSPLMKRRSPPPEEREDNTWKDILQTARGVTETDTIQLESQVKPAETQQQLSVINEGSDDSEDEGTVMERIGDALAAEVINSSLEEFKKKEFDPDAEENFPALNATAFTNWSEDVGIKVEPSEETFKKARKLSDTSSSESDELSLDTSQMEEEQRREKLVRQSHVEMIHSSGKDEYSSASGTQLVNNVVVSAELDRTNSSDEEDAYPGLSSTALSQWQKDVNIPLDKDTNPYVSAELQSSPRSSLSSFDMSHFTTTTTDNMAPDDKNTEINVDLQTSPMTDAESSVHSVHSNSLPAVKSQDTDNVTWMESITKDMNEINIPELEPSHIPPPPIEFDEHVSTESKSEVVATHKLNNSQDGELQIPQSRKRMSSASSSDDDTSFIEKRVGFNSPILKEDNTISDHIMKAPTQSLHFADQKHEVETAERQTDINKDMYKTEMLSYFTDIRDNQTETVRDIEHQSSPSEKSIAMPEEYHSNEKNISVHHEVSQQQSYNNERDIHALDRNGLHDDSDVSDLNSQPIPISLSTKFSSNTTSEESITKNNSEMSVAYDVGGVSGDREYTSRIQLDPLPPPEESRERIHSNSEMLLTKSEFILNPVDTTREEISTPVNDSPEEKDLTTSLHSETLPSNHGNWRSRGHGRTYSDVMVVHSSDDEKLHSFHEGAEKEDSLVKEVKDNVTETKHVEAEKRYSTSSSSSSDEGHSRKFKNPLRGIFRKKKKVPTATLR